MTGNYVLKSPYHKNKMLPFNILYKSYDGMYRVITEEYKGKKCYPVDTYYPPKEIQKLITKGIIHKKPGQ